MQEEKPTAAFVLSLIGGILILLGGLGYAALGAICGGLVGLIPGAVGLGAMIFLFMVLGVIFGILVIFGATMINKGEPSKVKMGSILVLVFSILSLPTVAGGFYIGWLLGLIGGILGLIWKPSEIAPTRTRICPSCGAQIDMSYNVCPHCGKTIPKATKE